MADATKAAELRVGVSFEDVPGGGVLRAFVWVPGQVTAPPRLVQGCGADRVEVLQVADHARQPQHLSAQRGASRDSA